MIITGKCQLYNNNKIVDYNIKYFKSFVTGLNISKKDDFAMYKGVISTTDLKSLITGIPKSIFLFIIDKNSCYYNKIIEFENCILKKQYPYVLSFLSKKCYVYFYINTKPKIHNTDDIFRKDKIKKIIDKFNI